MRKDGLLLELEFLEDVWLESLLGFCEVCGEHIFREKLGVVTWRKFRKFR